MGLNTEIRQIAREVFREEIKQLELALETQRPPRVGPEPLLTVEEVAKLCNVGTKTVQRWIAKRLLRAMRNPGMREYRITRRDYETFTSGEAGGGPSAASRTVDLDGEASSVTAAALYPRKAMR